MGEHPRPNRYDWEQMRLLRRLLESALENVEWMLEQDRTLEDRAIRAMSVSGTAAFASDVAKRTQRRYDKTLGWSEDADNG